MATGIRVVPPLTGKVVGCYGNLWIISYPDMQQGEVIQGHTHPYAHVSFLASGAARVTVEGCVTDYHAPNFVVIDKDLEHHIEALEEGTSWWCVTALRTGDGDVQDTFGVQHNPVYREAS